MNHLNIYNIINLMLDKDIRGNIMTPGKYNSLVPLVNLELFEQEWDKLKGYVSRSGIRIADALYQGSPLIAFKEDVIKAVIDGKITLPEDYEYLLAMLAKPGVKATDNIYREVTEVSDREWNRQISTVLKNDLITEPIGRVIGANEPQVQFMIIDNTYNVVVTYLRAPTTPYMDYCINNENDQMIYMPSGYYVKNYTSENETKWRCYNDSDEIIATDVAYPNLPSDLTGVQDIYDSLTVEFEWRQTYYLNLINRILEKLGIPAQDQMVAEYAQLEQKKGE